MQRNRKALALTMGMAALVLAACSESSSSPTELSAGLAVGDTPAPTPVAQLGKAVVCKTGNVGGSFDVTRVAVGTSTGTVSGLNTSIPNGTCYEVANDQAAPGNGSTVTIDEDPAENTVQTVVSCSVVTVGQSPTSCSFSDGGSLFVNSVHGFVLVYDNQFTPPVVEQCTYTKGWYRNNGSEDVTAVDGLTADEARQIFAATPGKPGDVTFGSNSLLNLYQQYLAALLNGGASGPDEVQDAIDEVAAGTDAAGLDITTTLDKDDISRLTGILSAYNEGTYEGFPHCDDEVMVD